LTERAYLHQDPVREERLYFFQFPYPFPEFMQQPIPPPLTGNYVPSDDGNRKVAFSEGVKTEQDPSTRLESSKESGNLQDGIIGQLEVYRSGTVKMRLANGILLDVRLFCRHGYHDSQRSLPGSCSDPTVLSSASHVS
jgi:DNA-directed RNA polymerase III subunit RPC4